MSVPVEIHRFHFIGQFATSVPVRILQKESASADSNSSSIGVSLRFQGEKPPTPAGQPVLFFLFFFFRLFGSLSSLEGGENPPSASLAPHRFRAKAELRLSPAATSSPSPKLHPSSSPYLWRQCHYFQPIESVPVELHSLHWPVRFRGDGAIFFSLSCWLQLSCIVFTSSGSSYSVLVSSVASPSVSAALSTSVFFFPTITTLVKYSVYIEGKEHGGGVI